LITNVIVLAQARSGSNLLCSIFRKLKPCRDLGEVFMPYDFIGNLGNVTQVPHTVLFSSVEKALLAQKFNIDYKDYYVQLLQSLSRNPEETINYLDKIIPTTKVIKILSHHLSHINIEFLLKSKNTKFILLERRNKLAQFVSLEVSYETGVWVNDNTSDVKVHVDFDKFKKYMHESDTWHQKIASVLTQYQGDFLKVTYEDDLNFDDHSTITNKIKDWLASNGVLTDVDYKNIVELKRQNLLPLAEKILNYEEIKSEFPQYFT
jgi:LPS sulfotransferase NodH